MAFVKSVVKASGHGLRLANTVGVRCPEAWIVGATFATCLASNFRYISDIFESPIFTLGAALGVWFWARLLDEQ